MHHFRPAVVLLVLGAAGCTAIYDDFEVVGQYCVPPPPHYPGERPCPRTLRECIMACDGSAECYTRCRLMVPADNMACLECMDVEGVICAVDRGCDFQYVDFTCCAVTTCPDGNVFCLIAACGTEFNATVECALDNGCDRVVAERCVR